MQTAAVIASFVAAVFAALWYYERTKGQDRVSGTTSPSTGVDTDSNDNAKLR